MVLIVGGDSTIGVALSNYWTDNHIPFHASTRNLDFVSDRKPFIDLSDPHTFRQITGYESAVLCASVTDMATCENTPKETRVVNVSGTIELIKKLNYSKTHILFLSTNQVFDGEKPHQKPDAPQKPINEYGRQKAEVEVFIKKVLGVCILRLTKVVHPGLTLLRKWKLSLSHGESIFPFSDMTLSPVDIDDVVNKIDILVSQKASGIFQLSGNRDISYLEFARRFARENGYSSDLVKKNTWHGKLAFVPPKYTSLVNV